MSFQWFKTRFLGVRYREHTTRKHGVRADRCFSIRYKIDGKDKEDVIGWSSEGWNAERAFSLLSMLRENINIKIGRGPKTLSDYRDEQEAQTRRLQKLQAAEVERPTVQRLWKIFAHDKAANRSIAIDDINYRRHLDEPFGKKLPEEISVSDMDKFRTTLLAADLAPQTVKNILSLLRRIINWAEQKEFCDTPVSIRKMVMPKVDNMVTENLTPEQIALLLKVLEGERDQQAANAMRLVLCTGMRKSAILALYWDDVDFERGFITLRGEVAKKGRTEKIPLPLVAQKVLSAIPRFGKLIFPSPGNMEKPRADCYRAFRRIKKAAKLPSDFRPMHGLRHTFASMLVTSGKVDMLTLQKLLTHGSPQVTQRYAHLHDSALNRGSSVADDILSHLPVI